MTQQKQLDELIEKYRSLLVDKAGEALIPSDIILPFLDSLRDLNVVIGLLCGWLYVDYYHDNGEQGIAQDLAIEFSPPEDILSSSDASSKSIALSKTFIEKLDLSVDFFSIELIGNLRIVVHSRKQ